MRLTDDEFRAINGFGRRMVHRLIEYPIFRLMGMRITDRDVLEIGCGNGYGASLLTRLRPRSYVGIDLMPEMIELANERDLPECDFSVGDATDLSRFPDGSLDAIVIFDILHHIPEWRTALAECHRVLRDCGEMYLEEPSATAIQIWDRLVDWQHPEDALFSRHQLEEELANVGLAIRRKLVVFPMKIYRLQKA